MRKFFVVIELRSSLSAMRAASAPIPEASGKRICGFIDATGINDITLYRQVVRWKAVLLGRENVFDCADLKAMTLSLPGDIHPTELRDIVADVKPAMSDEATRAILSEIVEYECAPLPFDGSSEGRVPIEQFRASVMPLLKMRLGVLAVSANLA